MVKNKFGNVVKRFEGLDENVKYEDVSRKCKLNAIFKTERDKKELKPIIKKDAENVSKALFLFQRHLEKEMITHVKLNNNNKADLHEYFTDLLKSRSLRTKFLVFCKTTALDLKNCSHLLINQINQYENVFIQNIRKNIRSWVQLYYEFLAEPLMEKKDAKKHVAKLFSGEIVDKFWEVKIGRKKLNLEQMRKKEFMLHMVPKLLWLNEQIRELQMLYRANRVDIPEGLETFNVVSQKKWGVQFIRFDFEAIVQLVNKRADVVNEKIKRLGLQRPKLEKLDRTTIDPWEAFNTAFTIKKFERTDRHGVKTRFGLSFSTNGEDLSIGIVRRADVYELSHQNALEKAREQVGVDPGVKNQVGIFVRNKNKPKEFKTIVRSSRQHHQEAGLKTLNRRRQQATKKIDKRCKKRCEGTFGRLQMNYERGRPMEDTEIALIDDDMKDFNAKFKAYSKPKLLNARFTHYRNSHKADDRFISRIVGHKKLQMWFYGNGWNGKTSFRG